MARNFVAASSNSIALNGTHAGFDTVDGSVAAWFKTSTTGTHKNILRRDGVTRHFLFRVSSANKLQGLLIFGGNPSVSSSGDVTGGTWQHGVMTWSWNGSTTTTLTLYLNGVSEGTNTASASYPSSDVVVYVGYYGGGEAFNGDIAEAAFWNAALTSGEAVALAKGASPSMVRPGALVSYLPLVRPVFDVKGVTTTVSGTTVSEHPRMMYHRRPQIRKYTTAAVPGGTIGLLRANAGLGGGPFSLANAGVGAIA